MPGIKSDLPVTCPNRAQGHVVMLLDIVILLEALVDVVGKIIEALPEAGHLEQQPIKTGDPGRFEHQGFSRESKGKRVPFDGINA